MDDDRDSVNMVTPPEQWDDLGKFGYGPHKLPAPPPEPPSPPPPPSDPSGGGSKPEPTGK